MNNVKLFYEKVKCDVGIQEQFKALQGKEQNEAIEAIIDIASENGFDFTEKDLIAYTEEVKNAAMSSKELDDAELDSVAGGSKVGDWIMMSAISLGFMCLSSLKMNIERNNCYIDETD